MPLYQTQTTSFKAELPQAVHNLLTDIIKIALYSDAATLNEDTTVYTTDNEITGSGYTAGGAIITGATVASLGKTAYINFDDVVWVPAGFTAAGGLIYNASKGNKSIAVLSFGGNKTASTVFRVEMPPNTVTTALLRFT